MKAAETAFSNKSNIRYHVGLNLGFLSILSLYINKAPHNLFIALSCLFSLATTYTFKQEIFSFIKKYKVFFLSVFTYFILSAVINAYHFGFEKKLIKSIGYSRWALLSVILIPGFVCFATDFKDHKLPKYFKVYASTLTLILFFLVLYDAATRVFFFVPSTSSLFSSSLPYPKSDRVSWTHNPIFFAQILFGTSLLFGLLAWTHKKVKTLLYTYSLLATLSFVMCLLTKTRATWLALVIIGIVSSLQIKKLRPFVALIILSVGLFIYIKPQNRISQRALSISDTQKFSNKFRLVHWKGNFNISKDHPFLGIGLKENRSKPYIKKYIDQFSLRPNIVYGHPHNEYLEILSGMGYFTLSLFLFILAFPLSLYVRYQRKNAEHFLEASLTFYYLLFLYISAFFDVVHSTVWSCMLISWCFMFYLNSQTERLSKT